MFGDIFSAIGSIAKIGSVGLGVYSQFKQADAAEEASQEQADRTTKWSEKQAQEYIKSAEANAELYEMDAATAMKESLAIDYQASVLLRQHAEKTHALIGSQITAYAKSGVNSSTGSARRVIADTARKATMDSQVIRYNGMTASEMKRDLARRFLKERDVSLETAMSYANMMMEVGEDEAESILAQGQINKKAYETQAWGSLATGVGSLYESGTFDVIGSWFD